MTVILPIVEVARRVEQACGTIRYHLNNGWFIDRSAHVWDRGGDGKYTLYIPGAGPGRTALPAGNENKLNDMLDYANRIYMS